MTIFYKDVTSSNIAAIAYHDGKAFVEFKSGKESRGGNRRFAYTMSRGLFDQMASPELKSIGAFFARHVKGVCPVAWSGWRCSASPCPNDATVESAVAGIKFHLCDSCKTDGKYSGLPLTAIEEKHDPFQ